MGPALLEAYREYLERVLLDSDNLVEVDRFTVPPDVDPDGVVLSEWCQVV